MSGISIAICSRNRCKSLERALASVLAQHLSETQYEVIVVDNGSIDSTRQMVESIGTGRAVSLRYVFESRPGLAYARNAAIRESRSSIVAFTDDDQELAPDWGQIILQSLSQHPQVDAVGGRVLPIWPCEPPAWIGVPQCGPLALIDRGPDPFYVSTRRWMCLAGGNFACRRSALDALAGFSPAYPRSQDREFQVRFLRSGRQALYEPQMIAFHHIPPARLTKSYFRRWHWIEGRMRAGFQFEELFDRTGEMWSSAPPCRQAFGVAGFVYRSFVEEALASAGSWARGRFIEAFRRQTRAIYLAGYIRERWNYRRRNGIHMPISATDFLDNSGRLPSRTRTSGAPHRS